MPKPTKKVQIDASVVNVSQKSSRGPVSGKVKRSRNRTARRDEVTHFGIQTGMSHLSSVPVRADHFSDQSNEFVRLYVDPCGEHTSSLDAARIPDGGLQNSSGGFIRDNKTIQFPWQTTGITSLGEQTYSLLVLQPPLLRTLAILIARERDGEFDEEVMAEFSKVFSVVDNQSPSTRYPNWVSIPDTGDSQSYFTIIDTLALRNVVPPNSNGISGTIDSYRFSSQGYNLKFNTPDLINQGTVTSMRYPTNFSTRNIEVNLGGFETYFLRSTVTANPSLITVGATDPSQQGVLVPNFSGSSLLLPSPLFTMTQNLRNAGNTFIANVGNVVRYQAGVGPFLGRLVLANTSTAGGNFLDLGPISVSTGITVTDVRVYSTGSVTGPRPEDIFDNEISVITIPPVTQGDMLQQNPKTTVNLLKDSAGIYLPSCIFEPIFNVTQAGEYRKTVFANKATSIADLADPFSGWFDTIDKNFSFGVSNLQGIPYACKPLIKLARSLEIVPASDSIVGFFTTGCPQSQPEAVDVAKAFTETQAHGYNSNFNDLGILFKNVMKAINLIPKILRSGRNISQEVSRVAQDCDFESDDSEEELMHKRSQSRLAARKPGRRR